MVAFIVANKAKNKFKAGSHPNLVMKYSLNFAAAFKEMQMFHATKR